MSVGGTPARRSVYRVHAFTAFTYAEVAEKLFSAIGRQVTYVETPLQAAKQAILDRGAPAWFAEGQAEQFQFRWRESSPA